MGVCRIVLSLPGNDSLKGKRAVVRRILDRSRNKFHVAAAEVGDLDVHRRATLGFSAVSNDASHVSSILDKLTSFVAGATEAVVVDREMELIHIGEDMG